MSRGMGVVEPVSALAMANLALTGATKLFSVGMETWGGAAAKDALAEEVKKQKAAQIAEETQRRLELASASRQMMNQQVFETTSARRSSQTIALYVVGGLAVGASIWLLYKAMKKRGG